jgi:hypothetical protein
MVPEIKAVTPPHKHMIIEILGANSIIGASLSNKKTPAVTIVAA